MAYNYITEFDSPNYWSGRPDGPVRFIVIHWWGDPANYPRFQDTVNFLCRATDSRGSAYLTSAHYVVSGDDVACIVDPDDRAWHAMTYGNAYGIGIECDPNMPGNTFDTVAQLVADLRDTYGDLPLMAHHDVPGCSTECPGAYRPRLTELSNRAEELRGAPIVAPAPHNGGSSVPQSSQPVPPFAVQTIGDRSSTRCLADAAWNVRRDTSDAFLARLMRDPNVWAEGGDTFWGDNNAVFTVGGGKSAADGVAYAFGANAANNDAFLASIAREANPVGMVDGPYPPGSRSLNVHIPLH